MAAATAVTWKQQVHEEMERQSLREPSKKEAASKRRPSAGFAPPPSSSTSTPSTVPSTSRGRLYRIAANTEGSTKWVTRDIAALDFLLNIPMEAETRTVQAGWEQQQVHHEIEKEERHLSHVTTATGRWWEKFVGAAAVSRTPSSHLHGEELERPETGEMKQEARDDAMMSVTTHLAAPGRRLDGDSAAKIQIPVSGVVESKTRQRSIARQAAVREWEIRVAHGLGNEPPMLDGRIFFSAGGSYPMGVFSVVRYEPKREQAARRRQKLEERGGGGSLFFLPERDWRGVSYRALLSRRGKKNKSFNLLLKKLDKEQEQDESGTDDMSSCSDESDSYVPGFLDDPEMVQGRHRHVMIGDRVTGCIVSSTIQFVKPDDLKADLNKQFRERFDGWEPPKSQWKHIGAKVIEGEYKLMDPTETQDHDDPSVDRPLRRQRQNSVSSASTATAEAKDTIRMPPSLTLSKIRSLKQQALIAAINANLEVSTVALACVYFERLCLDCRVDKSNRRLSFAACLILATKINESNVKLVMQGQEDEDMERITRINSFIRPTVKLDTIFESLLEFFTHDWGISLKHLFAAEWGVFAALGFKIHAKPSQVEVHYLRLMKVLEWSPSSYLGPVMYDQWQASLLQEELHRKEHEQRKEKRQERKERKLLELERELRLKQENEAKLAETQPDASDEESQQHEENGQVDPHLESPKLDKSKAKKGFFNRLSLKRSPSTEKDLVEHGRLGVFSMKRSTSTEKGLVDHGRLAVSTHEARTSSGLTRIFRSPSLPSITTLEGVDEHIAIDVHHEAAVNESLDERSIGSSNDGGIIV